MRLPSARTPSAVCFIPLLPHASIVSVTLFGARFGGSYFDFARFSFHVPIAGSLFPSVPCAEATCEDPVANVNTAIAATTQETFGRFIPTSFSKSVNLRSDGTDPMMDQTSGILLLFPDDG